MDSYKEKYLKYKKKYLTIKTFGGKINNNNNATKIDTTKNKYVASWNLSWAIQENVAPEYASEEDYARKCEKKYKNIKRCYRNSLQILKDMNKKYPLHLIGFQEVSDKDLYEKVSTNIPHLDSHTRHSLWKPHIKKVVSVLTCWNSKVFGKMTHEIVFNLSPTLQDSRPCSVVVTDKNFLIINVHFPWVKTREDIKQIEKKIQETIPREWFKDTTHILVGDTNDSQALINKNQPLVLKYGRKRYKFHNGLKSDYLLKYFRTCCWHEKGHKWRTDNKSGRQILTPGDYILSSDPKLFNKHKVYNSMKTLAKDTRELLRFTSDHYMVFSELNSKIIK